MNYRTTDRLGYRHYASDPSKCRNCPLQPRCTRSANFTKVVTRHIWQDHKEKINSHRYTEQGKQIYKRRKETVERSFADSKQLHGHRYARLRGMSKVFEQCLLCAAVQNMKKIALVVDKKGLLKLLRPFKGLYQAVPTVFFFTYVLLENIVLFIFKGMKPIVKENPA